MNLSEAKVLIVDDDPAMLRLLSSWLEGVVFQVQLVRDGRQALTAIEADCPDFIITDWLMPHVNGEELCRRVRAAELPHYVYILFLTVKGTSEELIVGLEAGADEYLPKPVFPEELLARMRAGLRVLTLERRLNQMVRTDPLTGLMTQRTFYEILDKEWHRALRYHLPLSCVMVDLDFFKRINDVHGHPAGDVALKYAADLLQKNCRRSDSLCRYGGEEFCVLLPETNECSAAIWAERARRSFSEMVIPLGHTQIGITASFGVAQCYEDTPTPEALVDLADQALLCAKRSGRDRVITVTSLNDAGAVQLKNGPQDDLFRNIIARHVMTPLAFCLREDETIGQAAEFFLRSRSNSAPVVDPSGKLIGMLSEKDLMAAMVSLDCWKLPVHQVMKPHVITYEENAPIRTIYEFLCRVSIRRVVIVDDGRPTGTISRGALLRWFRNLVLSKGLIDTESAGISSVDSDPHRSRERLEDTARRLTAQASKLLRHVRKGADDLVPYVVGGATGIQELVYDLLAYSRYANDADHNASGLPSSLTEGSYVS
ncbi:MAG: diguanylate cyclase [Pirellulales bacterium]|nr:diguanylate cyclase [Pirellulales bacterium]